MCICDTTEIFENCCGAIITKQRKAMSAKELMRSRYSAYVKADTQYLLYSTAKENRYEEDVALIEQFATSVEWLGLEIIDSSYDSVEFKAYYKDKDGIQVLHEKSSFIQEDGEWKYKDGILYNSKVERNAPCPCGSGKKYKKCCG